jgi:hypothetical protein
LPRIETFGRPKLLRHAREKTCLRSGRSNGKSDGVGWSLRDFDFARCHRTFSAKGPARQGRHQSSLHCHMAGPVVKAVSRRTALIDCRSFRWLPARGQHSEPVRPAVPPVNAAEHGLRIVLDRFVVGGDGATVRKPQRTSWRPGGQI